MKRQTNVWNTEKKSQRKMGERKKNNIIKMTQITPITKKSNFESINSKLDDFIGTGQMILAK